MLSLLHTDSEDDDHHKLVKTVKIAVPKQISNKQEKSKNSNHNHLGEYVETRISKLLHRAR